MTTCIPSLYGSDCQNLDLKYWGKPSLNKIGSLIGIPIKTNQYRKTRSMIHFARMLVEVPIDGPFPEYVDFFNEKGQLICEPVQFEWIPSKCTHCKMLGHTQENCKKKMGARKEWRLVSKPTHTSQDSLKEQPSDPEKATQASIRQDNHNDNSHSSEGVTNVSWPNPSKESNRVLRNQEKGTTPAHPAIQILHPNTFQLLGENEMEDLSSPLPHGKHSQLEH